MWWRIRKKLRVSCADSRGEALDLEDAEDERDAEAGAALLDRGGAGDVAVEPAAFVLLVEVLADEVGRAARLRVAAVLDGLFFMSATFDLNSLR